MFLSDEETLNLIEMLISKYVPACLDKVNVLEKLHGLNQLSLVPLTDKCPKCKSEMVCIECGSFDIDTETTVRVNGHIIYG